MTAAPRSTYRLQIRPQFDLDAAAATTGYLRDLGVDWAYLSPILQATAGSDHGYDVVDPTRVDASRGGEAGLARFAAAARAAGLGILIDVVPNHQGVARPEQNPDWWSVLTYGPGVAVARTFDIDWAFGDGKVRLPILGAPPAEVLAAGEIVIEPDAGSLGHDRGLAPHGLARYYDHLLPLAPGSLDGLDVSGAGDGADVVARVLGRQHWEPVFWRDEPELLNYRRFFTITSLAGVRVEDPMVFERTHGEILRWLREGLADGLRIDHPDGLADPGGYLDRLAQGGIAPGAGAGAGYVVVEKILEHAATEHPEQLPGWWATAGTTGYDALAEIDRVLTDPDGEAPLDELDARLRAESGLPPIGSYVDLVHDTKRDIAETALRPEVSRLVRCLPASFAAGDAAAGDADAGSAAAGSAEWADAIVELLANFPVYRSYPPAGAEHIAAAVDASIRRRPELTRGIWAIAHLLRSEPEGEFTRRFMQATGPVMAKGVEDTAFYRYTRLGSLTEVGADPSVFALPDDGLHRAFAARQAQWPDAMTTLTTHDTKRSEDVRARLAVLAERPERWAEVLDRLRGIASTGHGPFDNLLYQAIVGAWPASADRLHAYAEKAAREAGESTSWADPDDAFERRVHAVVDAATDGEAADVIAAFVDEIADPGWRNALSAKLLQLAGPGVPDVYQGTELWDHSLVDPDNRRAVDLDARRRMLATLDAPGAALPGIDASGAAKLLVVSRALRLRRDRPELFARYTPLPVLGTASRHAVAFDRGGAIAVATRLPCGLVASGGWGDTEVLMPAGAFVDVLTSRPVEGGRVVLASLLADYPVALLARAERGDA